MGAEPVKTELKSSVRFGEWLVSKGLMPHSKLNEALREQRRAGGRLGQVLLKLEMLSHEDITTALAEYLEIDYVSLDDLTSIDVNIARAIPENIAKRFCLIAIGEIDDKITVAMGDPLNVVAIDTVALKLKRRIKVVISSVSQIKHAIEVVYHGSDVEEQKLRDLVELEIDSEQGQNNLFIEDATETDISKEADASDAPVIRFVNLLLSQAVKSRVSDVHIEPQENSMVIRMRTDGILHEMVPPSRKMQAAVLTRIKILSQMNIAERRLPRRYRLSTVKRS